MHFHPHPTQVQNKVAAQSADRVCLSSQQAFSHPHFSQRALVIDSWVLSWPDSITYIFYYVSKFIVVICYTARGKQYRHCLQIRRFFCQSDSIISILKHSGQKFITYYQSLLYKNIIPYPYPSLYIHIYIPQILIKMDNRSDRQQLVEYINNLLSSYPSATDIIPITVDNCIQALHDGIILCYVVNCLSTVGPVIKEADLKKSKATLFHKMDQVNQALEAAKKVGLNIVNVRAEFIVEKKENVIIGLFNQIKRQRPGPKPDLKRQQSQQKTEKTSVYPQQTTQQPPKRQSQPINFIIDQPQPQPIHTNPQKPVSQPQQPQPPKPNPKQQIANLQINQHQVLSNQAKNGYNFQNAKGPQILVLAGSLRKGSTNMGIVRCLEEIKGRKYFQNFCFHVPDLSILPLLNYDLVKDGKVPKAVQDLREIARRSNGILIATPEYNGTFSGIIKNAFDWLSDSGQNNPSPLPNKKIGIVSASYLTQNQIRDVIEMGSFHKCNYFSEPFYISLRSGAFDMQSGVLKNAHEIDRLALWYQDFAHFVLSAEDHPQPLVRFIMNL